MTMTKEQALNLFKDETMQTNKIKQRLTETFSNDITKSIDDYINNAVYSRQSEIISPVAKTLAEVYEILGEFHDDLSEKEGFELLQQYFNTINPKRNISLLEEKVFQETQEIEQEYMVFFEKLETGTPYPTIVSRYKISEETFKLYSLGVHDSFKSLTQHFNKLAKSIETFTKIVTEQKEKQSSSRVGKFSTILAAAVLFGPGGGIAAKVFTNLPDQFNDKISLQLEEIRSIWTQLEKAYHHTLSVILEERFKLIYYTIYGGLLLKLQEDFNAVGLEISEFDKETTSLSLKVKPNEENRLREWAKHISLDIITSLSNGEFVKANELSNRFHRFFIKNGPAGLVKILSNEAFGLRTNAPLTLKEVVGSLRFASLATFIDQTYWEKGETVKASELYVKLLESLDEPLNDSIQYDKLKVHSILHIWIRVISSFEQGKATNEQDRIITLVKKALLSNSTYEQLNDRIYLQEIGINEELYILLKTFNDYLLTKSKSKQISSDQKISPDKIKEYYDRHLSEQGWQDEGFSSFLGEDLLSDKGEKKLPYFKKMLLKFSYKKETLFSAINSKDIDKVQNLIELGVNLNVQDKDGNTPLILAVRAGSKKLAKILVDNGVDLDMENHNKSSAIVCAVNENELTIVDLLLEHGANPNKGTFDDMSSLFIAARDNNIEIVDLLIKHNANIEKPNDMGLTPAFAAVIVSNVKVLERLLDAGADPNVIENANQTTPLIFASYRQGSNEITNVLIKGKAKLNIQDDKGYSALTWAAQGRNSEGIKLLSKSGADLNIQDHEGYTPLIWAATLGYLDTVKALLEEGANPNIMDYEGNTALIEADKEGHREISKVLKSSGAIEI